MCTCPMVPPHRRWRRAGLVCCPAAQYCANSVSTAREYRTCYCAIGIRRHHGRRAHQSTRNFVRCRTAGASRCPTLLAARSSTRSSGAISPPIVFWLTCPVRCNCITAALTRLCRQVFPSHSINSCVLQGSQQSCICTRRGITIFGLALTRPCSVRCGFLRRG